MNGLNIRPVNPAFALKECFFQFYLDEKHCDTKILTSNGFVKAHQLILKQNDVFSDLISKEDNEKIIVIDLTRFTSNEIRMVIRGIYRGYINYDRESLDKVQQLVNFFFRPSNIHRMPINHIHRQNDELINRQIETENIKEEPAETFLDVVIIDDSPPKEVSQGKQKKNRPTTNTDTGDTEESLIFTYMSTQTYVETQITEPEARAGSSRERDERPKKRNYKSSESERGDESEDLNSKVPKRTKTPLDIIRAKNGKKDTGSSLERDKRPKKNNSKSSESELGNESEDLNSKEPKRKKDTGKETEKSPNGTRKKDTGWIKSTIEKPPKGEDKNSKRSIEKAILKGKNTDCVQYCVICLVKEDKYSDHIKQHRQPLIKKHQCRYCDKVFSKINMLEWHKKDYCKRNKSK